jgi:hypothetical protein
MYPLSSSCELSVASDLTVIIKNRKTSIEIPAKCWKELTLCVEDIDEAVSKLKNKQYVKYQKHIGSRWHVSITTNFYCVDIRKFVKKNIGEDIRPTYEGLALRVWEWTKLVQTIPQLSKDFPDLDAVKLCIEASDHANQLGWLACTHCCPFSFFEAF